jgi:hypothetical protein
MFSGENNRMLDSFYFRVMVKTVGFLIWFGVSYLVLSA